MPIIMYVSLVRDAFAALTFAASFASDYKSAVWDAQIFEPSPALTRNLTWPAVYVGFDGDEPLAFTDTLYAFDENSTASTASDRPTAVAAPRLPGRVHGKYDFDGGGAWVFGGEAEYDWTTQTGYQTQPRVADDAEKSGSEPNITATAALRARLGYRIGRTAFYAAAGPAVISYDVADPFRSTRPSLSESKFHWGWTAGLGFEREISAQWDWSIAYRHANFSSIDQSALFPEEGTLNTHEILIGLAASF